MAAAITTKTGNRIATRAIIQAYFPISKAMERFSPLHSTSRHHDSYARQDSRHLEDPRQDFKLSIRCRPSRQTSTPGGCEKLLHKQIVHPDGNSRSDLRSGERSHRKEYRERQGQQGEPERAFPQPEDLVNRHTTTQEATYQGGRACCPRRNVVSLMMRSAFFRCSKSNSTTFPSISSSHMHQQPFEYFQVTPQVRSTHPTRLIAASPCASCNTCVAIRKESLRLGQRLTQ